MIPSHASLSVLELKERLDRYMAEHIARLPHPTERGVERLAPRDVMRLFRDAAGQMRRLKFEDD